MTRLLLSIAVLLLAAPLGAQVPEMKASDAKKLAKGLGLWVQADIEEDPSGRLDGRDEIQKGLESLAKKYPGAEVFRYLDAWGNGLELRGGDFPRAKAGTLKSDDLPNGTTVSYWIPENYKPKKANVPLVLWFRNGDFSEDLLAGIPQAIRDDYAVVSVNCGDGTDLQQMRGKLFFGLIWVSQQLRIDRNRVVVVADSDLAEAAVRMCGLAPHVAAGLAMVGEVGESAPKSLSLLQVEAVDSLEGAWTAVMDFKPRNPYPTEFEVELSEQQFGRCFWVHATKFDPMVEGKPATMKVSVDRAANKIVIDAESVYTVRLYLNDQIVDLTKPIIIERNGQEVEVSVVAGFTTLLETYRAMLRDTGALFPAKLAQIDIPPAE